MDFSLERVKGAAVNRMVELGRGPKIVCIVILIKINIEPLD